MYAHLRPDRPGFPDAHTVAGGDGGGRVKKKDITDFVEFGERLGGFLPLARCACGYRFAWGAFLLSTYPKFAIECPNCGRKMFFSFSVRVFEISE
jgi:hypothetical protein